MVRFGPSVLALALALVVTGCARSRADAPPVQPTTAEAPPPETEPEVTGHTFVSTEKNKEFEGQQFDDDALVEHDYGEIAVSTVDQARELAEAAVEPQLNPRQTWKTSPILPASWPAESKQVKFLFYPMADNPHSMSHYQLFSAAFAVTISLEDGTTEIKPLKTRKLGTIVDKRPSVLERNELELAERSLVHVLLGGEIEQGENSFWGYLKYFHEHPKFAADIKRHSPKFVAWLNSKRKRRR